MADGFDPYAKWLGIPPEIRPITPYLMLGLKPFEENPQRIQRAAEKRITAISQLQSGKYAKDAAKVLKQLSEAQSCLLDPAKKAKYDAKLRAHLPEPAAVMAPVPVPPPPPPGAPRTKSRSTGAPQPIPLPMPAAAVAEFPDFGGPPQYASAPVATSHRHAAAAAEPAPNSYAERKKKQKQQTLYMVIGAGGVAVVLAVVMVFMFMGGDQKPVAQSTRILTAEEASAAEAAEKEKLAAEAAASEGAADLDATEKQGTADDPLSKKRGRSLAGAPAAPNAAQGAGTEAPEMAVNAVALADAAPLAPPVVTEPDTIAWGVTVDAPTDLPGLLDKEKLDPVKPTLVGKTIAIEPGNRALALGAAADQIEVWSLAEGKLQGNVSVAGEKILALALPTPERLLVWSDKSGIQSLTLPGAAVESKWAAPVNDQDRPGDPDRGLAVSPTGKYVALVRNGVRIYTTEDGKLAGIFPVPPDQAVLGVAFSPKGEKLTLCMQTIRGPYLYRIVDVDVATGESNFERARPHAGDLRDKQFRGALVQRDGTNNPFWFLGNRYVLNKDDGKLACFIRKSPYVSVPLANGQVWAIENAPEPRIGMLPWEQIERFCRALDRSAAENQFGPGTAIDVQIETGELLLNDAEAVKTALMEGMKVRLEADEMSIKAGAGTKVIIKYEERGAGNVSDIDFVDADGSVQFKKFDAPVKAALPVLSIRAINVDQGNDELFKRSVPVQPEEIVATVEMLNQPADKAYAAAMLNAAASRLSGIIMPHYFSDGILGLSQLPIDVPQLK